VSGNAYVKRDRVLKQIGFKSYKKYLQSRLWFAIHHAVMDREGWACKLCVSGGAQIHHLRYDRADLLGHELKYLVPLCRECHHAIEHDSAGRKINLERANAEYERRLAWLKRPGSALVSALINQPADEYVPTNWRKSMKRLRDEIKKRDRLIRRRLAVKGRADNREAKMVETAKLYTKEEVGRFK